MLKVVVELGPHGVLSGVSASGHIGGKHGGPGSNLACAAATALIRSCAEAVLTADGVVAEGSAPESGLLSFRIVHSVDEREGWLRGVADVVSTGLRRLSSEAAGEIELVIMEGNDNGT